MGLATSRILLTVGIKVLNPILKYLKSKLEKEFIIYSILRKHNAIKLKSDFHSTYLETLYQLIFVKGKDREIIRLFECEEVIQAFKDEIYEKKNWTFEISLDSNLHTNPKLKKLKKIQVNLEEEITEFRSEFNRVVNLTREPKELEQVTTNDKILEGIRELIDTKKLNEKFKTDVEISNQIIFSRSEIHPLADHISKREKLVSTLFEKFKTYLWLAINGSISIGKILSRE